MSYNVSVLYPRTEGATFDMKYYLATHMPMVEEGWKPAGLVNWEVIEYQGDSKYSVAAILTWKDEESKDKALASPAAAQIMGDIVNFSSEKPVLLAGKIIQSQA